MRLEVELVFEKLGGGAWKKLWYLGVPQKCLET